MTSEQWHKDKVVAYIVIGIIVVVGIGLYVYAEISAMSVRQRTTVSTAPTQTEIRQSVADTLHTLTSKPAPTSEVKSVLQAMFAKKK
jgi:hypothetical protein